MSGGFSQDEGSLPKARNANVDRLLEKFKQLAGEHNPRARYCIRIPGSDAPIDDSAECEACQRHYDLMMLDPDVQVIGPRPSAEGNPDDR